MEWSETYKKWSNYLKSKKLYGAFIHDVGKIIVSENEIARIQQSKSRDFSLSSYLWIDRNLLYRNSGCFTIKGLNISNENELKSLIIYNLGGSFFWREKRSTVDWYEVYKEYVKFTTYPTLGKGLSRKARRANSNNKGGKYHYHDEQEIENIKWYNKFYEINAKNQFKNYRRR